MQEFTVSPRDPTAPQENTREAIEAALPKIGGGATIVAFHGDIGQAVIAIPPGTVEQMKAALGPDFLVDPRSKLNMLGR